MNFEHLLILFWYSFVNTVCYCNQTWSTLENNFKTFLYHRGIIVIDTNYHFFPSIFPSSYSIWLVLGLGFNTLFFYFRVLSLRSSIWHFLYFSTFYDTVFIIVNIKSSSLCLPENMIIRWLLGLDFLLNQKIKRRVIFIFFPMFWNLQNAFHVEISNIA